MRWLVIVLAGCHATSTPAPPRLAAPPPAPPIADECPVRFFGPTPEVVRVKSLAEAQPHVAAVVHAATEDLAGHAAAGPAFFIDVLRGSMHGSDSNFYDVAGVFVLADHVVVAKRVALHMSVIPNPDHMPSPERSAIEILSPNIGHIAIVQGDHVVDHFIDLERGAERLAMTSATPRSWQLDGDDGLVAGPCKVWWDD